MTKDNSTPYAIMRVEKVASLDELARRSAHNSRQAKSGLEHCDKNKTIHLVRGQRDAVAAWHERMAAVGLDPARVRKNGIRALEIVCTASPSWWANNDRETKNAWLKSTRSWIAKTVGGQENILQLTVHLDETTPHVHALAIPLVRKHVKKRGRPPKKPKASQNHGQSQEPVWALSANDLVGGSRDRLAALQSDYAAAVAPFGLHRGRPKRQTQARHKTVHEMRRELEQEITAAKAERETARQAREAAEREAAAAKADREAARRARESADEDAALYAAKVELTKEKEAEVLAREKEVERLKSMEKQLLEQRSEIRQFAKDLLLLFVHVAKAAKKMGVHIPSELKLHESYDKVRSIFTGITPDQLPPDKARSQPGRPRQADRGFER